MDPLAEVPPPTLRFKNGQSELIRWTELGIAERHAFTNLLAEGRTPEIVLLCTKRNAAWMESLDFDSYLELAKYFLKRNFRWALAIVTHDPVMGLKCGTLILAIQISSGLSTSSAPTPAGASTDGKETPGAPAPAASALETSQRS
ncbi:MAG TPA: hypothetical protein VGG34_01505 [Opitutaceae bacterium]|jgi:hypothetical protein